MRCTYEDLDYRVLYEIATRLDEWVVQQNLEAAEQGLPLLRACTIKVLGQTALMESATELRLQLATTKDVDVRANYTYPVQQEFERLLATAGRSLDPVGHEAWMPRETRYRKLFTGRFVNVFIAEPEAVLLSKALKAPAKNRALVTAYLASGPTERFLMLANKYQLDLEPFLQ